MDQYGIEAIVTVDASGQVVLPKEVRQTLGLEAGSKLAVVVMRSAGKPCCVSLMPAQALEGRVREVLSPESGKKEDNNE